MADEEKTSEQPSDEEQVSQSIREEAQRAALQQLSSPDQLDELLVVAKPRLWIVLFTVGFILTIVTLWSIFGRIPIKVEGRGIVMNDKGLFQVRSLTGGTMGMLSIKPGDFVKKGSVIGQVINPQEVTEKEAAQVRVISLEADLKRLKADIEVEERAESEAIQQELQSQRYAQKTLNEQITETEEDVRKKKELYEDGLIRLDLLQSSERTLRDFQVSLERVKAAIAELILRQKRGYRTDEFKAKELQLERAQQELEILTIRQEQYTLVSPFDGKVLEVMLAEGAVVQPGAAVAWIEHTAENEGNHLVYAYVAVEQGKKIEPNTPVNIDLSVIDKQEYGTMLGTVREVSQYAVSQEQVMKVVQNAVLVQHLTGANPAVVQLLIDPTPDPNTVSGYAWTSGKGPPIEVTTGTICTVKATVQEIRPISYLFPIWKVRQFHEAITE